MQKIVVGDICTSALWPTGAMLAIGQDGDDRMIFECLSGHKYSFLINDVRLAKTALVVMEWICKKKTCTMGQP